MLNHCTRRFLKVFMVGMFSLFLAAASGLAAGKEEFPGESDQWRRYQSPHFEMFSTASKGESRKLLHQLELLRALFFETFKMKERQPLEVTIYCFSNEADFKAYIPEIQRQEMRGYYLYRPDRAVITLSPARDEDAARATIFHEYIHHLNKAIGLNPPLWYNEGVAELFSTIEFESDGVILGKSLPWRLKSLRENGLLPLETLFAVELESPIYNHEKYSRQFYAESWALLHYWRYGDAKMDKGKFELFLNYVQNEHSGADPVARRQEFKATVGIDYPEMEKRLEDYVRRGTFSYAKSKLPQIPDKKSYTLRVMAKEEIRMKLAELSLRINQSALARLRLLEAVGRNPSNAHYWEVLGADAWMLGDLDVAQERWQRALEAGSNNPAIIHELGQSEGQRWFANFDFYFRLPAERAQQLRSLLKRSIDFAPDQREAYETLAWVEASVVNPDISNINFVQSRFDSLRLKARTMVALALIRMRLDDRKGALQLLDQVDQMNPDYWVASAAEIVRAKLENRAPRTIGPPLVPETPGQWLRIKLPVLPE